MKLIIIYSNSKALFLDEGDEEPLALNPENPEPLILPDEEIENPE